MWAARRVLRNARAFPAPRSLCAPRTSLPGYELDTNVSKDVILFKYENPKFFKYMNWFAVGQYLFWSYLSAFAFTKLRDAPAAEARVRSAEVQRQPWYLRLTANLNDNKYKNTLAAFSLFVGGGSLALIWMYTLKSVRFLILHKGGRHLTLVTYAPFGNNRMMKVPIEAVCCKESRTVAKVQLPLKVKNTWLHYMLDMRGEFKSPTLFDQTAGLYRKL